MDKLIKWSAADLSRRKPNDRPRWSRKAGLTAVTFSATAAGHSVRGALTCLCSFCHLPLLRHGHLKTYRLFFKAWRVRKALRCHSHRTCCSHWILKHKLLNYKYCSANPCSWLPECSRLKILHLKLFHDNLLNYTLVLLKAPSLYTRTLHILWMSMAFKCSRKVKDA